jgi:hypothetical protein
MIIITTLSLQIQSFRREFGPYHIRTSNWDNVAETYVHHLYTRYDLRCGLRLALYIQVYFRLFRSIK